MTSSPGLSCPHRSFALGRRINRLILSRRRISRLIPLRTPNSSNPKRRRSDDTDARKEALRCFGRSHRSAQCRWRNRSPGVWVGSGDLDLPSSDRHELRLHEPSPRWAVRASPIPTPGRPVSGDAHRGIESRGRDLTWRCSSGQLDAGACEIANSLRCPSARDGRRAWP